MNLKLNKSVLVTAVLAACSMTALNANAGGTISFGEDKSVSVGFGMRASYTSTENAAPNGTDRSNDFSLDNARIFLSGSLNKYIKGMLNTQNSGTSGSFQVIDANVQFVVAPEFTIWAGRFLSPSDRANMAGPYYSLGGGYWANIASRYGWNGGYIGRDDGVAAVGTLLDGKLSYSLGAFEGSTLGIGSVANTTVSDNLMYAGRLQYDFWDAEPGYYGTGNYLGAKDILAIGLAGRTKSDGATTASRVGDYTSYSVDFLLEKKGIGPGAVSVEAAYYDYDTSDVILAEQGQAYSAGAGYIFNDVVGIGQFQPYVRFQKFDADTGIDKKRYDLGLAYIIDGYNAQVSGFYSNTKTTAASSVDAVNIAMQFQF